MKFFYIIVLFSFIPLSAASSLTISQSGNYTLGVNIPFSATAAGDEIININASNVVLDLGQHTIAQSNLTDSVQGIVISPNNSQITIRNGTILSVTGTGIFVGANCSEISLENIICDACATVGVECDSTSNIVMKNCKINNCCTNTVASGAALFFSSCSNIEINGLSLFNNGNTTRNLSVLLASSSTNGLFNNITMSSNIAGATLTGYDFNSSAQITCNNCSFVAHRGDSTTLITGFNSRVNSNNLFWENCICLNNSGGFVGFRVDTSTGNIVKKCKAIGNYGVAGDRTIGIYIVNSLDTTVDSCLIQYAYSLAFDALGVWTENSINSTIVNSAVYKVMSAQTSNGFLVQNANVCEQNNIATDVSGATAYGFALDNVNNSYGLITQNITTNVSGTTAALFLNFGGTRADTTNPSNINVLLYPYTNIGLNP